MIYEHSEESDQGWIIKRRRMNCVDAGGRCLSAVRVCFYLACDTFL
jgi:hypothetical protein